MMHLMWLEFVWGFSVVCESESCESDLIESWFNQTNQLGFGGGLSLEIVCVHDTHCTR